MKSFLHDSSAFDDEKVYRLYMEYDYKGIGIFWTILEKLAQQEKPIDEMVIMKQLSLGKRDKPILDFMDYLGLIKRKNGEIFNENLSNYIRTYVDKRKQNAKRMKYNRDNQQVTKNVQTHSKDSAFTNTNTNTNTNTIVMDDETFEEFWDLYDINIGKRIAYNVWLGISASDKEELFKRLPNYLKNKPKQYRKSPERFLSQRAWEDEVIVYNKPTEKKEKPKHKTEIIVPDDF